MPQETPTPRPDQAQSNPEATQVTWSIPVRISVRLGTESKPVTMTSLPDNKNKTNNSDALYRPDLARQDDLQSSNAPLTSSGQLHFEDSFLGGKAAVAPVRRMQKITASALGWYEDTKTALSRMFRVDEDQLKSVVWFVEARFAAGVQHGSGVAVKVVGNGLPSNLLLTCQHVIRHKMTGQLAESIRCWPNSHGYTPHAHEPTSVWVATPKISSDINESKGFLRDGSRDWVLLDVVRQNYNFNAMPHVAGFSNPKASFLQRIKPYRLVGFPGGGSMIKDDVVAASISRDFRLNERTAKPGEVNLTGSEPSAAGLSGAPYMTPAGKVVAIHRSLSPANTQIGVSTDTVEQAIQACGLRLVKTIDKHLKYFVIQAFVVCLALLLAGLVGYQSWLNSAPGDITLHSIEGDRLSQQLKRNTSLCSEDDRAKIDRNGLLTYIAPNFEVYGDEEKDGYVALVRLRYRGKWLGLFPSPTSEINLLIRDHITIEGLSKLCQRLQGTDGEELGEPQDIINRWSSVDTRPVLTITVGKADHVFLNRFDIRFEQIESADAESQETHLIWFLGDFSPTKSLLTLSEDKVGTHVYRLRHVVIEKVLSNKRVFEVKVSSALRDQPNKIYPTRN